MANEQGIVSPALLERPVLQTFENEAWNAFARLTSRRPITGFGAIGAIPYSEILAYIDDVLEVSDPEDRSDLIELIEYLDGEYLKEFAEKQEQERKKQASKTPAKANMKPPRPR